MAQWLAALSLAAAMAMSGRRRPVHRLAALGTEGRRAVGTTSWVVGSAAVVGAALVAAHVPPPLVVVAACGAALTWHIRRGLRAAKARDECSAATVEVTFALVGELRAGRTPAQALAAVAEFAGPLRPALDAAQLAVALGADAADELGRAAQLPGAERLRYVAAAWSVADSAGGRVAVVLERLSEAMDSDDELRRELDAAMAGPRATMVLLAGLPLMGLALGQSVGAHPLQLLLHRPLGWGLLTVAALLDGLGVVATRAIARVALRP
jgi:tight adherence protein B